jgi:hypothetical protein
LLSSSAKSVERDVESSTKFAEGTIE